MAKWIQKAIKNPGAFRRQAKQRGLSVKEFEEEVLASPEKFSSTTVKRARLSRTLRKLRKK